MPESQVEALADAFMIAKVSYCYSCDWRVLTYLACGVVVGEQGVDEGAGLVGDGGCDGGLVGLGAVEGVHLERGVDTCAQLGGRVGEQGGGVRQFAEECGVFGGGRCG